MPYGHFERRPGNGRLLAVGDAAGFAEPVTGEGIPYAVESGLSAAEAIGVACGRGNPDAAAEVYNSLLKDRILRLFRHASLARWLLFPRLCLPLAMRTLRAHPELARQYYELTSGGMSYPEYFRKMVTAIL
jgi:flavin-dependent dehydrogenase